MKGKISRDTFWDYFILTARFLLAWTFLRYGYSKLVDGGQFGINGTELTTEVKDLSLFKLSWYLFDHEPFKSFIGISQLICGLLLLVNRTTLIGAFIFLPIVITILIIDLTFMPAVLAHGFAWRLSFYILLDLLIFWHYKDRMKIIWDAIWNKVSTKYKYPLWMYILLPIFSIVLELLGVIPRIIIQMITQPSETIDSFMKIPELIGELIKRIGG